MKVKILNTKLSLKKETIAHLSRTELGKVQGGIQQSFTFKLRHTDLCDTLKKCQENIISRSTPVNDSKW